MIEDTSEPSCAEKETDAHEPWQAWDRCWRQPLARVAQTAMEQSDAAHDGEHIRRVVANVRTIGMAESADPEIAMPAAWLHDCVSIAKNSPQRSNASRLAADRALELLQQIGYPSGAFAQIRHAIEAHSFSAKITPHSIEAEVLQDADRLDAIGAIGIARCLLTGGAIDRPLYDPTDPFADHRPPDDGRYTLDHFYAKLLQLEAGMKTPTGRRLARQRTQFMQTFLDTLRDELAVANGRP